MKIHVYSDPGHGWGKVKISILKDLGILEKITSYSYMRGEFAYLEEDCDLTTLVLTLRAKGIEPKFIDHHANKSSRIRNYQHFSIGRIA